MVSNGTDQIKPNPYEIYSVLSQSVCRNGCWYAHATASNYASCNMLFPINVSMFPFAEIIKMFSLQMSCAFSTLSISIVWNSLNSVFTFASFVFVCLLHKSATCNTHDFSDLYIPRNYFRWSIEQFFSWFNCFFPQHCSISNDHLHWNTPNFCPNSPLYAEIFLNRH